MLFAKDGAHICCNSITKSAQKIADKILDSGGDAFFSQGDISIVEDAQKIVEETIEKFGKLDILFNNAGIVIPGTVDNTSPEDWDRTMAGKQKDA